MKRILSTISLILAAALLSGCSGANESSSTTDTDTFSSGTASSVTETSSATVSSAESSVSSVAPITSVDESPKPPLQIEPAELEQVLKRLADYGVFMFDSFPPNRDNYDVVDKTKRIPTDYLSRNETSDGMPRTIVLDASSINESEWHQWRYKPIDSWTELLGSMTTENMREKYVHTDSFVIMHNGEMYIDPTGGGRGVGLGSSYLLLDSLETPDENTYILTVTDVGDKEEWGLQEDWLETEVVKVVKTAGGLRVDECSRKASEFFQRYSHIKYGDAEFAITKDTDIIKNLT